MASGKKKILLIDDDAFFALAYKYPLEQAGFEVSMLNDTASVLKKILEIMPDLVLLDLIIQPKNGFQVLKELKDEQKTHEIPVIVFSNLSQASDIEKVKALGAADYFVKGEDTKNEVAERIKCFFAPISGVQS